MKKSGAGSISQGCTCCQRYCSPYIRIFSPCEPRQENTVLEPSTTNQTDSSKPPDTDSDSVDCVQRLPFTEVPHNSIVEVDSEAKPSPVPDLSTCDSLQYQVKDGVQGVNHIRDDGSKAWTPIQRESTVNLELTAIGDGSRMNPRMSTAQGLPNFQLTKEVSFLKVNGSPGLRFRRGGTNRSYQWVPIAPSLVATRTRAKTKDSIT